MKIILGKQIEKVKKKDSENEKNLLKNRNSEDINELDADDVYFHSNAVKNIKLGSQLVNRIYLNNSIVYDLEDTIDLNLFHSLVPAATATSIVFDKLENQDVSNFNLIGFCDANNHIAVYNNNTEYLILNIRNAINYAPKNCYMFFYNYEVLINCVLYNFNTNNVTNMSSMFNYCSSLTSLDLSSFNTNNVTNMSSMFDHCSSLTSLDLSSFNTQNVTNMNSMFNHCSSLTSLDLSSFNTQNVTNMGLMFSSCFNITSLDVSNFDTSKVTVLAFMFDLCFNLTSLDVSNFDTSNAISMNSMFGRNENLASLDLRNFNTAKVTTMNYMFYQCYKLDTIFSKTFILRSGLTSNYMFYQCNSLVGSNGTLYSSSHINAEYARVDGENGLPGYFTAPPANNK